MIIGYVENGEIRIYENIDEVMSEWGKYPTDLASEVIVLYDNDGRWLEPIEQYAPRTWYRWYEKLEAVELKRAEKNHYQDSLGYLLAFQATTLKENKFVKSLEELKIMYPYEK